VVHLLLCFSFYEHSIAFSCFNIDYQELDFTGRKYHTFIDIGIFVTDSYFEYCVLGLLLLSSYVHCCVAILCTSCLIVLDLYYIIVSVSMAEILLAVGGL